MGVMQNVALQPGIRDCRLGLRASGLGIGDQPYTLSPKLIGDLQGP